jgi:Uri superfamily endonuclease
MRPDKGIRWHVDHLTTRAASVRALAFPGGDECALVTALLDRGGLSIPLPGLGASDCVRCPAHLLAIAGPAREAAARVARWLDGLFPGRKDG